MHTPWLHYTGEPPFDFDYGADGELVDTYVDAYDRLLEGALGLEGRGWRRVSRGAKERLALTRTRTSSPHLSLETLTLTWTLTLTLTPTLARALALALTRRSSSCSRCAPRLASGRARV